MYIYIIVRFYRIINIKIRKNLTLLEITKIEVLVLDILDRIISLLGKKEQRELTDYLGLKKTAFSDWKSGKSNSYRKYLIEISEFFNVSIDYLVYGKERTVDEPEQTKTKNADNKEQTGARNSFKNVNNRNTYNGTANITIGNDINQTNFNMADKQSSRSSDTDKIVQELDEMMRSLDDEKQREALATQVRSSIQTFQLLFEPSKKKQN